jgi:hypothetical protein
MKNGDYQAFPTQSTFPVPGDRPTSGLNKREWMVGQLAAGLLAGKGAIPPLKEIWDLADNILAAGEPSGAQSPPDTL